MPLGSALNSLFLLARNLDPTNPTTMPVKKVKNDKPVVFPSDKKIKMLERAKPEDYGVSSEYIESYFRELDSDHSIRPNRFLIIKDDKVIAEKYNHPYVKDSWDCVFSSSKTVVALALGVLYDEGKVNLDVPVCKYLGNEKKITILRNKKITLRHLLTMSTGITFNEMETASSLNWVKSFFDSGSKFRLGDKFEYNSLNTYIISVCVEKVAKQKFEDFVREKLFDPLDINETHFDTSPEGYFKGGWGLYILPEDMAKIGIMIRDNGLYKGKRVLSEEWINMMSHKQFESTKFNHIYDYGFQMWVDEKLNFSMANGMYDQDIIIYRNTGVVVVTCCANNEAFHGCNLFKISSKYFATKIPGDFELCKTHGNRDLLNNDSLLYYYDLIANKDYKPISKLANSCGVLPLLLQNELGTYSKGIKNIVFKKEATSYSLNITEGHKTYELEFNFGEGVRKTYEIYGNKFDCSIDARFILSGKSEPFLVIRLFFLEFSSSRYFTIKFGKDLDIVSIELSENPGLDFVNSIIDSRDESTKTFLNGLLKNMNPNLLSGMIKNIFSPSFLIIHGDAKIKKLRNEKEKPANKKQVSQK